MISTKFFTYKVLVVSMATFGANRFPTTFGGHLEFLHKTQKHICLGDGARLSNFDEMFYPQVIRRVICHFWQYSFSAIFGSHLEFLCKLQIHIYLRNSAR